MVKKEAGNCSPCLGREQGCLPDAGLSCQREEASAGWRLSYITSADSPLDPSPPSPVSSKAASTGWGCWAGAWHSPLR